MITTIILDDEPFCVDVLETIIQENFPSLKIVGLFSDPSLAIEKINNGLNANLMFIDVNMPRYNGFEVLDRIMPFSGKVVFTTAYDNFALKAMKYGALDYLLKPISSEDLKVTMNKIYQNNDQIRGKEDEAKRRKIIISNLDGMIFQNIDEILYCEADNSYSIIHLSNGKKIVASKTLKEFESQLHNFDFFRIHNSFLVNMNFIDIYIKSEGGFVQIKDQKIPVSRAKKDEFVEAMQRLLR